MRAIRIAIGVAAWLAGVGTLAWHAQRDWEQPASPLRKTTSQLWRYAAEPRREALAQFRQPAVMGVGDPIFVADSFGKFHQVGEVRQLWRQGEPLASLVDRSDRCEVLFYPELPPLGADAHIDLHHTPDSLAWVAQTMLPPEKRAEIIAELQKSFADHHEEIIAALRPVVESALREAATVVQEDLSKSIVARRARFEKLGAKYQVEIVEKDLEPLIRDEVFPIVRRHAEPVANEIGREIWERAPKVSLIARYVYDRSVLPKKDLFQHRWDEFVEQDIVPTLQSHTGEILAAQKKIFVDVANNKKVRETVRESLGKVIDDPELQGLVWEVLRETFIDNPRLRETLDKHWQSDEARQAMQLAADRLEPTVRRIGDMLFGNETEGISPEFAAVVRSQILAKDRRWLILDPGHAGITPLRWPSEGTLTLPGRRGDDTADNPFGLAHDAFSDSSSHDELRRP